MTPWARRLLALIAAGLALRLALAVATGPQSGDPLFSYQYRATLIAAGHWDGVLLMWHPPGYPLLLAAVMTASGHLLSSYATGLFISLVSTVALVCLVDRLVRTRLEHPAFRLVAAGAMLFNDGLVHWQSAVLTEPPYLAAIAGVLVLLDRDQLSARRLAIAGALAGAATLLRIEAAALSAGLFLLIWHRAGLARALAFGAGFAAVAGWLIGNVSAITRMQHAASSVLTRPEPLPWRLPAGLYHAMTEWLPHAVMLPFWGAAAIGICHLAWGRGREADRRLNAMLLTILAAGVLFGSISIMHKRTAAFVVPLVAIWTAVAADRIARDGRRTALVMIVALAAIGVDALRLSFAWPPKGVSAPSVAQAGVLRDARADPGPVFAFGSEPEIYAQLAWPIVTKFFDWPSEVRPLYDDHRGNPAAFVQALASRGYRWLAVVAPRGGRALQPYGGYVSQPLAADIAALEASPSETGVSELGRATTRDGQEVRVYRIAPR